MFMEKSQALHKVHLVASGNNGSMMFYPLVTRVSITICVVWCQCIFGSTGQYLDHITLEIFLKNFLDKKMKQK